jgi:DNA primase
MLQFSDTEIARVKESVDIAALIGASVALKRQGDEWVGLCPFHNENTPSFNVVPKKSMYYCFGCGATGDAIHWLQQVEKISFLEAVDRLRAGGAANVSSAIAKPLPAKSRADSMAAELRRIEKAREIWKESKSAKGTLVEQYLKSRGLAGAPLPATIRFHPRLWNAEAFDFMPAMVAAVIDRKQKIVGVHRTYLKRDGSNKADCPKAKMMLGACRNCHVWLDMPAGGRMAVAEGIETALSVKKACPKIPVWAALSLNNMAATVPDHVMELILCADADNKDQDAADKVLKSATRKHMRPGRIVRIARPKPGCDFNDMLRSGI